MRPNFAWPLLVCAISSSLADQPEEVDVAIIGAGYSGLVAAHELWKSGVSFRIFEARDRVGGRTLNWLAGNSSDTDDVIELGGEWLAPQHKHALELVQNLGFSLFKRPYNTLDNFEHTSPWCSGNCSIRVFSSSRGWQDVATQSQVFNLLSQQSQEAVNSAKSALFQAAKEVPCDAPQSHPNASFYDSLSYAAYLSQVLQLKGEAYNWLAMYADDADSLSQISALSVLWTRSCTGGVVGSPREDFWRVRGGTQGPAQILAKQMQEHLYLRAPVTEVHELSGGKRLILSTRAKVVAKEVLIAGLSPPLVLGIRFHPPLPADVDQLLQRYPLGTSLKFSLVYSSAWWRSLGFLGKILILSGGAGASTLYTAECLDNSPYSWSRGVLMCFIEGDQNRAFMRLTATERKTAILDLLGEAFGESHPDEIEDIVEHNWADDEYSRGAYSSYPMTGVLTSFWQPLSSIYSNQTLGTSGIWVAGADYNSGTQIGYIDGAIESGMNVAERIVKKFDRVLV